MEKTDYRKALEAAKIEFEKLVRERLDLDERIVRLKQTIAGLTGLCDATRDVTPVAALPPKFTRLTSAIRQVLAEAVEPIRPPEMRDALVERGLNMSQYANKLAVIHNTLARLERQGEVIEVGAGWLITDKGRLASRIDALDVTPPIGSPVPAARPSESADGGNRSTEMRRDAGNPRGLHNSRQDK